MWLEPSLLMDLFTAFLFQLWGQRGSFNLQCFRFSGPSLSLWLDRRHKRTPLYYKFCPLKLSCFKKCIKTIVKVINMTSLIVLIQAVWRDHFFIWCFGGQKGTEISRVSLKISSFVFPRLMKVGLELVI